MKVILKKDVQSLGEAGDIVEVKDGYARNFLLPNSMVEVATKGALENRERNIERIKAKAERLHQEAVAKSEKIDVTQEDIDTEFQAIADQYKMSLETVKNALAPRTGELANQIYQRKIMDFLREANKIA